MLLKTRTSCEILSWNKVPSVETQAYGFCTNITHVPCVVQPEATNTPTRWTMYLREVTHELPPRFPSTLRLQHLTASALLDPGFLAPLTQIANSHQLQKGTTWSAAIGYNYCSFCFYVVQRLFFFLDGELVTKAPIIL